MSIDNEHDLESILREFSSGDDDLAGTDDTVIPEDVILEPVNDVITEQDEHITSEPDNDVTAAPDPKISLSAEDDEFVFAPDLLSKAGSSEEAEEDMDEDADDGGEDEHIGYFKPE